MKNYFLLFDSYSFYQGYAFTDALWAKIFHLRDIEKVSYLQMKVKYWEMKKFIWKKNCYEGSITQF